MNFIKTAKDIPTAMVPAKGALTHYWGHIYLGQRPGNVELTFFLAVLKQLNERSQFNCSLRGGVCSFF